MKKSASAAIKKIRDTPFETFGRFMCDSFQARGRRLTTACFFANPTSRFYRSASVASGLLLPSWQPCAIVVASNFHRKREAVCFSGDRLDANRTVPCRALFIREAPQALRRILV